MAGLANRGSIIQFVAADAHAHRRHAGCLRHRRQIGDLSVAGLALHSRVQMFAVSPVDPFRDCVHAHPGNGLPRLCGGQTSFWIDGLFVATVAWHDIQMLVAGNVIKFPGSGFVWHMAHSSPNAKCVRWL